MTVLYAVDTFLALPTKTSCTATKRLDKVWAQLAL
jgi:hypothetical protein